MPTHYKTEEFERLLRQREALWNQTLRSLSNSIVVRQQIGDSMPEPQASLHSFDMGSLLTNASPQESALRAIEREPLREMRSMDDLIGAARFYGIEGAERMPLDDLEELVSRKRESLRDYSSGLDVSFGQALYNGVATAIGQALTTPGQQTLRVIGNLAERLPFMGDAVARGETMREADRWFSMIQEGLTADLPEGRRELSRGVSGAIGLFPAAILGWKGLGAVGLGRTFHLVGNQITPIGKGALAARFAVRGGLTEMMIQDPTAPLPEQAINALFGTAFGGAEIIGGLVGRTIMGGGMGAVAGAIADDGDPRTMMLSALAGATVLNAGHLMMNKARRSFPSASLDADFNPGAYGQGMAGPMGGPQPQGQLPPGALTGTVEDAMQARVGRGQPWLPEESSFLGDADFRVIEDLAGLPPGQGQPALPPGQQTLPPGQYEVYGVGGPPMGAVPDPTTPTGEPSVWMQTPPEVRQFIRRLAGERRAARRAAETDAMTGAGNRAAWERARGNAESDPSMAIVALDVNNLKAANDLIGHQFGDEMITNASQAAAAAARETGVANRLFRTGGDEFVAIVPQERAAAYVDAVERLYGGHDAAGYTVSLGAGVGQTLHEADVALRALKASRNGQAYRNLQGGGEAAHEASQLTKQSAIIESPVQADLAPASLLDDADVAWAITESFPGQVGVVQNVGDVAATVRRILMDQMPNGVGPQDFRVVQRQVIRDDLIRPMPDIGPPGMTEMQGWAAREGLTPVGMMPEISGQGFTIEMLADAAGTSVENFRPIYENLVAGSRREAMRRAAESGEAFVDPLTRGVNAWRTQTDILVSSGRPISNKMVEDYKTYGMFAGQRARLSNGSEGVIEQLGPEVSLVRPQHGGPASEVPTRDLLPMKASGLVDDIPGFYDSFQQYAGTRLDMQSREAGTMPIQFFSDEGASQMPLLMDEFLRVQGVDPQGYYGATLRQLLEQRHIEALRNLAPIEEQAMLRAVQAELASAQAQHGSGMLPATLDELAAARGFSVARRESGIDLIDEISKRDVRVPVEDETAAREFLHGFQRESLDNAPATTFPLEAMETPPAVSGVGGRLPEDGWRSADDFFEAVNEVEANWFALGGEAIYADMMTPGGGGGGQIPPPPPPPLGMGGAPDPLRLPPTATEAQGRGWTAARRDSPNAVEEYTRRLDSIVTKMFYPTRNVAIGADAWAKEMGLDFVRFEPSVVRLQDSFNRMKSESAPWKNQAYEITRPVRSRFRRDGTLWEALNSDPGTADAIMRNAGFRSEERKAVQDWHELFGRFWNEQAVMDYPDIGFVPNYVSHFRRFDEALPGDPFRNPRTAEWGPAHTRGDVTNNLEKNTDALIMRYFDSFFKARHMREPYDEIKALVKHPEVPQAVKSTFGDWADHRMWGVDPSNDFVLRGTHAVLNALGKAVGMPVSKEQTGQLLHTYMQAWYGSSLGGRADQVIRDLPQVLLGGVQVGFDKFIPVMRRYASDPSYRQRAWQIAEEHGVVQPAHQLAVDPDMFGASAMRPPQVGSAYDPRRLDQMIGELETSLRAPGLDQATRANKQLELQKLQEARRWEGVARVGDEIRDRLPGGGQKSVVESMSDVALLPYGIQSEHSRVMTFMTAYESAQDALQRYSVQAQSGMIPREQMFEELLRSSRVSRQVGTIQDGFLEKVQQGDLEGAARYFGRYVSDWQNRFGLAEHPRMWREMGPMGGRMAMRVLTFNSQMLANFAQILKDPRIPFREKSAILTQVSALQGAYGIAQAVTGWNFMRMSMLGIAAGGLAGSSFFDWTNRIQQARAWVAQFDPTRRSLTPMEEAMLSTADTDYGSRLFTTNPARAEWNPWAGAMRSIEGISQTAQIGPEAVGRFLVTGERDDPWAERLRRSTDPNQMIDEILNRGAGPIRPDEEPPETQPGFGAMY